VIGLDGVETKGIKPPKKEGYFTLPVDYY